MKTTPKKAISKGAKSINKIFEVRWLELSVIITKIEAKSAKAALKKLQDIHFLGGETEDSSMPLNQSVVCEEATLGGDYNYEDYVDRLVKSNPEFKGISEQLLSIINNE